VTGETRIDRSTLPVVDHGIGAMAAAGNYNRWLFARAKPFLGRRVLDAGAGIGTFATIAHADGYDVVAAEPDPPIAALLRERLPEIIVAEVVLEELPSTLPAESADAAICFNVIEHIEDDVLALRGIRHVLTPGGHLALIVPAHPALFGSIDRTDQHYRRYTKRSLGDALDAAGFDAIELRYVNPVGIIGWLVAGKLLRKPQVPDGPLALYDRLVPVFRLLDALRLPFGLSVWAVARRR
jgi:SAM-dependent methyltransferase